MSTVTAIKGGSDFAITSTAELAEHGVALMQGDSKERMAEMAKNSVDAIVTDPPYGLTDSLDTQALLAHWLAGEEYEAPSSGFMNKDWDSCVPSPELWREAYRVLKPGAYLVAFAGSRTSDLTSISLRLAGFDVKDIIQWTYGQGMPHSTNIGEHFGLAKTAIGSGLKPAHEPIIVARKPQEKKLSLVKNTEKWGVGGLNIDAARVGDVERQDGTQGRWPANVILSHGPDCQLLGEQRVPSTAHYTAVGGGWFARYGQDIPGRTNFNGSETAPKWSCAPGCPVAALEASGEGRSRYFEVFHGEREDELAIEPVLRGEASALCYSPKPGTSEREAGLASVGITGKLTKSMTPGVVEKVKKVRLNTHPTIKPAVEKASVMRWLIRLVCPTGGLVLDPFNGSGSTGIAAVLEKRDYIGIDLDETEGYLDITAARILHWAKKGR